MKKVIVCDLDGTLAQSKSPITPSMVSTICEVLQSHHFAVISGGDWPQFQKQFLTHFTCPPKLLKNLLLFPTSGAECFSYNPTEEKWVEVYDKLLKSNEKKKIESALSTALHDADIDVTHSYGDVVEDRGEQITFSGRGQEAPLMVKASWDPNQAKRKAIVAELLHTIPEFEIEIGGMTSIDITQKNINKKYAIEKIEEILRVKKENIVYIGDALYPGGNDEKARDAGVECIQVSGPEETEKVLKSFAQGVTM